MHQSAELKTYRESCQVWPVIEWILGQRRFSKNNLDRQFLIPSNHAQRERIARLVFPENALQIRVSREHLAVHGCDHVKSL